jgi:DNA-binding response OmpR family regulator
VDHPKKPPCILVVDDDDAFRDMVTTVLTREGYEVEAATDGLSALAVAESRDFDMAIVDVSMPKMNGFDLVRHLRALPKFASTPIVMLTGAGSHTDIVRGFDLGVSDYIVKPFNVVEFVARVARLL